MRLTFLEGFDEAILGLVEQFGMAQPVVVYDRAKVIAILQSCEGLSLSQAEEVFANNVENLWLGEDTPAFAILA